MGKRRISLFHVCQSICSASANSAGAKSKIVWEMLKRSPISVTYALAEAFNQYILQNGGTPDDCFFIVLHGIPKPELAKSGQFTLENLRWIGLADVLQKCFIKSLQLAGAEHQLPDPLFNLGFTKQCSVHLLTETVRQCLLAANTWAKCDLIVGIEDVWRAFDSFTHDLLETAFFICLTMRWRTPRSSNKPVF